MTEKKNGGRHVLKLSKNNIFEEKNNTVGTPEKKNPKYATTTQQVRKMYAKWGWASFLLCGYFLGFFGFRVPEASLCTTLTPKVQKSPESGKKQKKKKNMFCGQGIS